MLLNIISSPDYLNSYKCSSVSVRIKAIEESMDLYPAPGISVKGKKLAVSLEKFFQMMAAGIPLPFDLISVPDAAYKFRHPAWDELIRIAPHLITDALVDTLSLNETIVEGETLIRKEDEFILVPYDIDNTIRNIWSLRNCIKFICKGRKKKYMVLIDRIKKGNLSRNDLEREVVRMKKKINKVSLPDLPPALYTEIYKNIKLISWDERELKNLKNLEAQKDISLLIKSYLS